MILLALLPGAVFALLLPFLPAAQPPPTEQNGLLEVEAENFTSQDKTAIRKWVIHSTTSAALVEPDGDPSHAATASGGAYIEVLPDTRRTHDDKLIAGQNFSNQGGELAVVHYRVKINTPGRYHVWVSAYSTGSEDNGIHVGLNGAWPESGARMQWCEGKNSWRWQSSQRTEQMHCGEPGKIWLDIDRPGEHTISFSLREDGFEMDK
jgi:hypothetical protein